jgi:hypothetical protein
MVFIVVLQQLKNSWPKMKVILIEIYIIIIIITFIF